MSMAGIYLDVDWNELSKIRLYTETMETNTREAFIAGWLAFIAHPYLQGRIDRRFATEGDAASGKWAQLRLATAFIRKRKGYGPWHPINKRTGQLHEYVRSTYTLTKQGSGQLNIPGPASGVLKEKLAMAQLGGNVARVKGSTFTGPITPAPPRPVLALGVVDEQELTNLLFNSVIPKTLSGPIARYNGP